MNIEESFETAYLQELEVQKELEKIELAYVKMVDKYRAYSECTGFVHYIKTLEKVFTEARMRNWNADKSKEELIKVKIELLSGESHLDKELFQRIYDDFKKASHDIGKIKTAANDLRQKYNDEECREFISYIEYVLINFETNIEAEEVKRGLIKAKMGVISCDGHPDLKLLEKIYADFSDSLAVKSKVHP